MMKKRILVLFVNIVFVFGFSTVINQDGAASCLGFNCSGSEPGHLFYNELSVLPYWPITASSDPYLALFSNLQSGYYFGQELNMFLITPMRGRLALIKGIKVCFISL